MTDSVTFYKDFWEYTPEGAAAYRDVILADNPIMYWRLGETSGTIAYDESANHRDATYIHQPLSRVSWRNRERYEHLCRLQWLSTNGLGGFPRPATLVRLQWRRG